jgi:hypothetical protein
MPLKGTRSNAERKVFFALKERLPEPFIALHSVSMLTRGVRGTDRLHDGEIDFLIGHPDLGLLVLEVKGGGIRCCHDEQRWTSVSTDGEYEIKNPYEQVRRSMYSLIDELKISKLTPRHEFPVGYAVWFPDIEIGKTSLGLSTSYRQITLDATSLHAPEAELRRIFSDCLVRPTARVPGLAALRELTRHFVPEWSIPARMRTSLNDEEHALTEATRSQHKVLSMLGRRRRALICGSAGSGKTFLAMEKARRLGEAGGKVLLLCFNRRLAGWLHEATADCQNVDTFNYHGLCEHVCKMAGHPVPQPDPLGPQDAYFRYELPEAMMAAIEESALRYDVIIVDEAQDFDAVWWICIESLMRDPVESLLFIFYDDNQRIYESRNDFPIQETPLLLCENCRNTQTIFTGFMPLYRGEATPECVGPEGRAVEIVEIASAVEEKRAIESVLRRLIHDEHISPSAIVILSGRAEAKSMWKDGASAPCNAVFSWRSPCPPNAIACSTIHAFKGMESSVVVVTEISGIPDKTARELLYVAYSRAKFHLIATRISGTDSGTLRA